MTSGTVSSSHLLCIRPRRCRNLSAALRRFHTHMFTQGTLGGVVGSSNSPRPSYPSEKCANLAPHGRGFDMLSFHAADFISCFRLRWLLRAFLDQIEGLPRTRSRSKYSAWLLYEMAPAVGVPQFTVQASRCLANRYAVIAHSNIRGLRNGAHSCTR